ncbi:hypothetical protein IAU60_001985 [Kwoniella sp. DSM 27419]
MSPATAPSWQLDLSTPASSGASTPLATDSRPHTYFSNASTAVNTPSGLEDKPFLFPAASAALSKLSKTMSNGSIKDDKERDASLTDGDEPVAEDLVAELPSCPLPGKKMTLSKGKMLVLGLVMMTTTFIAAATISATLLVIPSIAKDLGVTELQAQWVSSAYSLANGCGLLLAGRVADLYGKRWLFLLGMALYVVFTVISGVIRNYIAICVVRALAGLAISISLPAAFGIIGVTFTEEPYRTMAFAALALGYPVGSGPGLIFAGLVAGISQRAWQYVFFILAGLALVPVALGFIVIPKDTVKSTPGDNRRIDWIGAILITSGLSLFSFALTQSGVTERGWSEPYIGATLGLSIILMLAFGFWEHHVARKTSIPPLVNLGIFSRNEWRVTAVLVLAFFAYCAIAGWVYLTTIWYQNLKGDAPIWNALHILPAPIVGVVAVVLVPYLAPRVRAPYLLILGGILTGTAQMLFAVQPLHLTYWACSFLSNIVNPFGADFTVGVGSVLISNLVAEEEQSLAGALFQTSLQIASTVGVCVSSLIQTLVAQQTGSLHRGLQDAFWAMAAFSWASAIIAAITLRKVGLAKDVGNM